MLYGQLIAWTEGDWEFGSKRFKSVCCNGHCFIYAWHKVSVWLQLRCDKTLEAPSQSKSSYIPVWQSADVNKVTLASSYLKISSLVTFCTKCFVCTMPVFYILIFGKTISFISGKSVFHDLLLITLNLNWNPRKAFENQITAKMQ